MTEDSGSYAEQIEDDGMPAQGSITQMETVEIPFDTWEFDAKTDFTNITYASEGHLVEYVSDDIVYDAVGTYSSIYKMIILEQQNPKIMRTKMNIWFPESAQDI